MKLRLVSRLMVLALVVVVGMIILLHQHSAAGGSPRAPAATHTPTVHVLWPVALPAQVSTVARPSLGGVVLY
jgi:hypothetical protein